MRLEGQKATPAAYGTGDPVKKLPLMRYVATDELPIWAEARLVGAGPTSMLLPTSLQHSKPGEENKILYQTVPPMICNLLHRTQKIQGEEAAAGRTLGTHKCNSLGSAEMPIGRLPYSRLLRMSLHSR